MRYPNRTRTRPTDRYIPAIAKHEESLQLRIATYLRREYPHVLFFSDYAAGLYLTGHQADIRQRLQSGKGWPDMFIAWPQIIEMKDGTTKHYCGLFIELKIEGTSIYVTKGPRKGKLVADTHIQEQAAVLEALNKAGYCAVFGVGYDNVVRIVDRYMGRPESISFF